MDVGPALGETLKKQPISLVLMVGNIAAASFIVGLFGYHTFLLLTNQTTNEQLKKTWKLISGNPYKWYFVYLFSKFIKSVGEIGFLISVLQ